MITYITAIILYCLTADDANDLNAQVNFRQAPPWQAQTVQEAGDFAEGQVYPALVVKTSGVNGELVSAQVFAGNNTQLWVIRASPQEGPVPVPGTWNSNVMP